VTDATKVGHDVGDAAAAQFPDEGVSRKETFLKVLPLAVSRTQRLSLVDAAK